MKVTTCNQCQKGGRSRYEHFIFLIILVIKGLRPVQKSHPNPNIYQLSVTYAPKIVVSGLLSSTFHIPSHFRKQDIWNRHEISQGELYSGTERFERLNSLSFKQSFHDTALIDSSLVGSSLEFLHSLLNTQLRICPKWFFT